MNKLLTSTILIISGLSLSLGQTSLPGIGGSTFHKNDITYSTEVVTPHVKWATKLPGGPIKSFFIPSIQYGRDMIELMQRLQLAPTTDSIDREWDINCWGVGDYYGHEYRGDRDDYQIVYSYVERDLTGDQPFEVMVIPGLNGWSRMTRRTRDAILNRVRNGAGLILLHPFLGDVKGHPFKGDEPVADERLWELSPLIGVPEDAINERGYPERNQDAITKGRWEIAKNHFITEGISLDLLPEGQSGGSFYKYQPSGDVLIRSGNYPILAVKNYGKGRVAAFAYVDEGFTPPSINPVETKIYWDYWEYQYSVLARAVLWAAGREHGLHINSLSATPSPITIQATLNSDRARSIELEIDGHNEFGDQLGSVRVTKALNAGENRLQMPAPNQSGQWSGGQQIFNVIIRDAGDGSTLNWGATTLQIRKRAMMTLTKPAVDVYKRGETLSAVLRAAGDFSGLQMRMRVTDDLGRLVGLISKPARGERTFTYTLANFLGKVANVTGELVDERGAIVDQLRAKPVMVVQNTRRPRTYTALVSFGGTKHYLQDAQMRMVRAVAADTGFTWGGDVDNSLNIPRGTFGVYWYDRGPTTPEGLEKAIKEYERTGDFEALGYLTKKELFRRTGDKKYLQRTPSFNDPVFMRSLSDIVRAVARNKARYNMDYYFVGDEGSLTSYGDEVDFDWNPQTLNDFRLWLQHEYVDLATLNKEWKTNFKSWSDVVPFTTDEARKTGNFAPWADHRTFMEITFAKAYQIARNAVVEGDPDGHIAVSGTQATNAYDGADWARLDRVIDDFLSYDGGNQWDMHRSFARPNAMIGFWTGYGSRGLAVQNVIWTAAIHNVLHPNIFWMYSFLDPDFTYSQSAHDMGVAFKSLKFEGVGELLMHSQRLTDGIAIHYSMPSVHGASILGYHHRGRDEDDEAPERTGVSYPANRDGWVRTVKDLGLQFLFVSSDQIESGALASSNYKVLILPFSSAMSVEEINKVRAFAEAGGIVVADAATGIMDEHCAWRRNDEVNQLFGIASSQPSDRRTLKPVSGAVSITSEGERWGMNGKDLTGIATAESNIKAATGTALLRVGDTDAVVVRQVGKGWAIYLNALFDTYSKQRAQGFGGGNYRSLIASLLSHTGVQPTIEVLGADGQRLPQAQIARYRFGDAQLITIVKDNVAVEGVAGRDGVTVYNDQALGRLAKQDLTIRLPAQSYVTDVRSGQRLGYTNEIHRSIIIGDALVFGLSPSEESIAVTGPSGAKPGDAIEFKIKASGSGPHLIRCHVFGPDGSMLPAYSDNILMSEPGDVFVLPFALNDPKGVYRLITTDVVSGATTETKIALAE
jgi:hypothetical protein